MSVFSSIDCTDFYYGPGCLLECKCNGGPCDDVTGECHDHEGGPPLDIGTTGFRLPAVTDEDLSDGTTSLPAGGAEAAASGDKDVTRLPDPGSLPTWVIGIFVVGLLGIVVTVVSCLLLYRLRYVKGMSCQCVLGPH